MPDSITRWLLLVFLALANHAAAAQEVRELPLMEISSMRIWGTSNKSDWTVDVTEMTGQIWLNLSDDSTIMDRLMYEALKSDEHPAISYAIGPEGVTEVGAVEDTTVWATIGTLDLAGVRDTLAASIRGYRDGEGRFVFAGSHAMSMREHDIEPPTAMFGALRTREQITISFDLVFGE
jgi:hypothetical protein